MKFKIKLNLWLVFKCAWPRFEIFSGDLTQSYHENEVILILKILMLSIPVFVVKLNFYS